jgi:hypothetical protein
LLSVCFDSELALLSMQSWVKRPSLDLQCFAPLGTQFVPSHHDVGNLYPKDVDRLSPPD